MTDLMSRGAVDLVRRFAGAALGLWALVLAQVGPALAAKIRDTSIRLYREAADYARGRGIILGQRFAAEVKRVLSVPAPVRTTSSGRLVATVPALARSEMKAG
jgi:hypothetical protein